MRKPLRNVYLTNCENQYLVDIDACKVGLLACCLANDKVMVALIIDDLYCRSIDNAKLTVSSCNLFL